jgi:aminoglycoside phosphotransferase (APT) family kinase protein
LASRLAELPPTDRQLHGDFYAKQVLLRPDGVAVLDFDEAARGDPGHDLGLFLAHLEWDALRGRVRSDPVEALGAALLEGYRAARRRAYSLSPDLYAAAGLLRLAPHPFRNREPDWPERTAALLDRAEEFLGRPAESVAVPAEVRP